MVADLSPAPAVAYWRYTPEEVELARRYRELHVPDVANRNCMYFWCGERFPCISRQCADAILIEVGAIKPDPRARVTS